MIHIGGKPRGKKSDNKSPEDKFNETIYDTYNSGKPYNPYNNTGNYLFKNGPSVSPKEIVNIYLDKYKSKKNQEDNDVPYGFYIINHSDPNLKGLFFNIVIPEWVDTKYPEIKGSLEKLGSLRVEELHDENNVKRIEYIDMIDTNEEQNPEICETISKNEEKEAQTKLLQKKIEKLKNQINEIEQHNMENENMEKEIKKIEIKNIYEEKQLIGLQSNLKENRKRLKMLQDDLKKLIQQLENIDTFQWNTDDKRMLITPKFKSLVDTDHPTKVCSKTYERNQWWDQPKFEQTNNWESDWFETEDETIQFNYELEKLNKMYCEKKTADERTCTSSKPWYKTSIDQLCDFQPGYLTNGCEINPEKAKILVKEREKLYDDCMYRQSCQTDAGTENGIPKYFKPYMKGKYFPRTANKDIPICCKRSFVAVVENVLTIKQLEKVFGYMPTAVFRKEITKLGLEPSVEKMLIKNHEKDEQYLKESIKKEENISNADELFYTNIGEIVKKYIEIDFEKIINNTGNLMLSQNETADDATKLEEEDDQEESFYSKLKSNIADAFGKVKTLASEYLKQAIEIMKKGARWIFLKSGPFVMALKWLCDAIKEGLCFAVSGKLIADHLNIYYVGMKEQVFKLFEDEHKELSCEQKCEKNYNDKIETIKAKYVESALREEAAAEAAAEEKESAEIAAIEAKDEAHKRAKEAAVAKAKKKSSGPSIIIPDSNEYDENPDDEDEGWYEDYEFKKAAEDDRLYKEAKKQAEMEKDRCQKLCQAQSYIEPIVSDYIKPKIGGQLEEVLGTGDLVASPMPGVNWPQRVSINPGTLYREEQMARGAPLFQPSTPLQLGPLTEKEYKTQKTQKAAEEASNELLKYRLERLQRSDIANSAISFATASGKEIFSRFSKDKSLSTVKAIANEHIEMGKGLLRDKITDIYIGMRSEISDLASFIKFTLFTSLSFFKETFVKIWANLVLILSSLLESVVNTLTFGLINKLNIPLAETATIFFDPLRTVVANSIYQKYMDMLNETDTKYPNLQTISFFKEWHLCCLNKIKFFDRSEIVINIKTIDDKMMAFECSSIDTISMIKDKLRAKLGISQDQTFLLTFENNGETQELNDENKTLTNYEVKNDSTIQLTFVENKSDDETQEIKHNGGNFRRMYDDQVLTKLYQTYKNKRLSKNDKLYLHNILFMILRNVKPSNYTQSHKNILLLMFKD
jgi:hypothetical protein